MRAYAFKQGHSACPDGMDYAPRHEPEAVLYLGDGEWCTRFGHTEGPTPFSGRIEVTPISPKDPLWGEAASLGRSFGYQVRSGDSCREGW